MPCHPAVAARVKSIRPAAGPARADAWRRVKTRARRMAKLGVGGVPRSALVRLVDLLTPVLTLAFEHPDMMF